MFEQLLLPMVGAIALAWYLLRCHYKATHAAMLRQSTWHVVSGRRRKDLVWELKVANEAGEEAIVRGSNYMFHVVPSGYAASEYICGLCEAWVRVQEWKESDQ